MESEDCIQDRLVVHEAQGGSHAALSSWYTPTINLRLAIRIRSRGSDAQDIYQRRISEGLHEAREFPV